MTTELDTRLTAAGMRAAYSEGHRDGVSETNESNARYVAGHQIEIAASALALALDMSDAKLARRAVQIASRALGTTPLNHLDERLLALVRDCYQPRTQGVDCVKLAYAHKAVELWRTDRRWIREEVIA